MNEYHCYIVSYDLCKPGRDYNSLYNALRTFPSWGKLTESTWAVVSKNSAVEIRNYLRLYMDVSDRLIVIKSGQVAAWTQVIANNLWVKENLVK